MSEQSLFNTCIFSLRHITAWLHLGTLDSTLASYLGPFKQQNHQQKHKNVKNMELNRPQKKTLVYSESGNKKAEHHLVELQLGTCTWSKSNLLSPCACS